VIRMRRAAPSFLVPAPGLRIATLANLLELPSTPAGPMAGAGDGALPHRAAQAEAAAGQLIQRAGQA